MGEALLSFLLDSKYGQAHVTIAQDRDQLRASACRAWSVQGSESRDAGWRQLVPGAAQS